MKNFANKRFFKFAPKHWWSVLFPPLTSFLLYKIKIIKTEIFNKENQFIFTVWFCFLFLKIYILYIKQVTLNKQGWLNW